MEKSAAYLLGVQHGMGNRLDLEKTAELLDLLDAPGIEKQAVMAAIRKLLGLRGVAAGSSAIPGSKLKRITRPMTAKPRREGIRSPMLGGGSTRSF